MLWIKVAHVLFVIAWMAGLFYLPRIFVHHQEGSNAGEDVRRLVTMAQKLFRFSSVMMVLAIVPGTVLWLGYGFNGGWMHAKLGFVGLLLAYHGQSYRYTRRLAEGQTIPSSLYFRIYNEAALLLVIPDSNPRDRQALLIAITLRQVSAPSPV